MEHYFKKIHFVLLALITLSLAHPPAFAGKDRGAEDGVSCNGGLFFLFLLDDMQVSDQTLIPESAQFELNHFDEKNMTETQMTEAFLSFIGHKFPTWAADLRVSMSQIHYDPVYEIEKIDTGLNVGLFSKVLFGCSRKQLAIQDFNIPSYSLSSVRLYMPEFNKLSLIQRSALKIHEGFIYMAHEHTQVLKEMEIEARKNVATILSSPDLLGFLLVKLLPVQDSDTNSKNLAYFIEQLAPYEEMDYRNETLVSSLSQMLDAGLKTNEKVDCKMPLLNYLISHRKVDIGENQHTPGNPELALELLKRNPSLTDADLYNNLPIHLAVQRKDKKISEALIAAGADINAPLCKPGSKEGSTPRTPLDLANWSENLRFLKSLGAKHGKELTYRCPSTPKVSRAEKNNQNCGSIKEALAF